MIPILIKDFEWSQNADFIFIILEVKGIRTASTDITSSPTYLKVHYPPFIFEVFLSHDVADVDSECTIDEKLGKVSFRLKKALTGVVWEDLQNKELTKEEKSVKRDEAIRITQERHEKEKSERERLRYERKQIVVHDQIRVDAEEKQRVNKIKASEGERALTEFNNWAKSECDNDSPCEKQSEILHASGDSNREEQTTESLPALMGSSLENVIKTTKQEVSESSAAKEVKCAKGCKQIFDEPGDTHTVGIRPTVNITVSFTPRIFPTPSRESTHLEEQEWLKKQTEARRLSGFVDEDLRPEERNPQWLLDKGLSLMRTESYLGAISAFSLGIRLAPKMPELFVERACAHLAIKNYNRAVADSTQALDMLKPKVQGNLEDRLKCHVCRGRAFRELEMWEEALADYKEAILLKPENNEELTSARDEIQIALETAEKKNKEWGSE